MWVFGALGQMTEWGLIEGNPIEPTPAGVAAFDQLDAGWSPSDELIAAMLRHNTSVFNQDQESLIQIFEMLKQYRDHRQEMSLFVQIGAIERKETGMKYAIIDTETTGLFNFRLPADDPSQPRLANLAVILLDEKMEIESVNNMFVQPDGWTMTEEATAINGLTDTFLMTNGMPIVHVLGIYTKIIESGYAIAAFNAQYDTKIMRGEFRRAGMDDLFEKTPNVCIMRAATPVCKIPAKNGRGLKFPKLVEACDHFGITYKEQHIAAECALAAMAVMKKLIELDALPEPTVHYAKNRPESKGG